jgi:hypothetical protein
MPRIQSIIFRFIWPIGLATLLGLRQHLPKAPASRFKEDMGVVRGPKEGNRNLSLARLTKKQKDRPKLKNRFVNK